MKNHSTIKQTASNNLTKKMNQPKKQNMKLNKDFIVPKYIQSTLNNSAQVSDKNEIAEKGVINPSPLSQEEVIHNPSGSENQKSITEEKPIISGSNYQNIIPEVGVKINEEDKTKNGGLNFQKVSGRMSVKQYEKIREYYMGKNAQNAYKQKIIVPNNNANSNISVSKNSGQNLFKVDEEIKKQKHHHKKGVDASEMMAQNWKISNYNWDNVDYNYNNFDSGLPYNGPQKIVEVVNENLFKKKKFDVKSRSIYNKANMNYMNKFNNGKVLSNANWGSSISNKQSNGLSMTVPQKKSNEPNMRTRRK